MSIVDHGEKIKGLENNPGTGYLNALIHRAKDDFERNYSLLASRDQIDNLSWDDIYIQLLRNSGEEFKAADFMSCKFLKWILESINNQDGQNIHVPAFDCFYQNVNDSLRYHFNSLNIYNGHYDCALFPDIDWSNQQAYQQFRFDSGKLEELGILKDPGSSLVTPVSCGYLFNDQGQEISGLVYQFGTIV